MRKIDELRAKHRKISQEMAKMRNQDKSGYHKKRHYDVLNDEVRYARDEVLKEVKKNLKRKKDSES